MIFSQFNAQYEGRQGGNDRYRAESVCQHSQGQGGRSSGGGELSLMALFEDLTECYILRMEPIEGPVTSY